MWICVGVVVFLIGYLAYKDIKIRIAVKELDHTWDELKKIEGQSKSWLTKD